MQNNTYHFKLSPINFQKIVQRKRRLEIRLNNFKKSRLKYGDIIEFAKLPDIERRVKVMVIGVYKFDSFFEIFTKFSLDEFGFVNNYSKSEFIEECYSHYTKKQEREFGVIIIEFEILS